MYPRSHPRSGPSSAAPSWKAVETIPPKLAVPHGCRAIVSRSFTQHSTVTSPGTPRFSRSYALGAISTYECPFSDSANSAGGARDTTVTEDGAEGCSAKARSAVSLRRREGEGGAMVRGGNRCVCNEGRASFLSFPFQKTCRRVTHKLCREAPPSKLRM